MCSAGRLKMLPLLWAVMMLTPSSWGQSTSSVDQQFASYHTALAGTADELLLDAARAKPVHAVTQDSPNGSTLNANFGLALTRVQRLRPLLEPILRERAIPADIAAVVLVESGGNPFARSRKGALGLWQLMPETARRYGLMVSSVVDERTDPIKSTKAATRYLSDLYQQFGDWRLAFAAYNAGEQAVQRATTRARQADFEFISNYLPAETRAYVPAVLSARPLFTRTGTVSRYGVESARKATLVYASMKAQD